MKPMKKQDLIDLSLEVACVVVGFAFLGGVGGFAWAMAYKVGACLFGGHA